MPTTEKIKDTISSAADRLKHVAHDAMEKLKHAPSDLKNVVTDDMPNLATASRTVIITRELAASPAKVFNAWTEPALIAQWWGPKGWTSEDFRLDLQVGGRWAFMMVGPDGSRTPCAGEYRVFARPERIVMFNEGEGEPMRGHATTMEMWFEPHGSGTRLHLVHGVFKTTEMRNDCIDGWSSSFDRLERLLDGK